MKGFFVRNFINGFYAVIAAITLLTFNSCEKEYSCEGCFVINIPPDTAITDSTLYTDFTIDGQRFLNISGKNNYSFSWDSHYFFLSSAAGNNQLTTQRDFFIYDSAGPDIKLQRLAFYAPGNYSYEKMLTSQEDGVRIFFTDVNGKLWQTDLGTANQTNSSFIITKATAIHRLSDDLITGVLFEASFNCTLYDGLGNYKTLTNGKCRYYTWI
jgi:hypothetical protein